MLDFLGDGLSSLGDVIGDALQWIIYNTIYKLMYYIAAALCWFLQLLYSMIEVFAGLVKVSYDGAKDYLINVFFSNQLISNVYWGMALIGIALCFAFTIVAVTRKMFDLSEKVKQPIGGILGGAAKSILVILLMSAFMSAMLNTTNILMQRINYLFSNAETINQEQIKEYSNEEYAAMARVYNIIGNYSLNPSATNRYNINSCYNELRPDLQYLQNQGVFDVYYVSRDANGNEIETWQSVLQKIVNSTDPGQELKMDIYYESVSNSIGEAMEMMKTNGSFAALQQYDRKYVAQENMPIDRLVFLTSAMRAAKNDAYNENPSMTDPLRGPYYVGEKSIYDLDSVNNDFDIGISSFDYLILLIAAVKLIWDFAVIIVTLVARIFNLLILYLISPPIAATMALDDGGKMKQWTLAFVVQCFSVFGTVIAVRLFMLFLPIVANSDLVLFENEILNLVGKLVLILGASEAAKKASAMIGGILADMAGFQAIMSGDMSAVGRGAMNSIVGAGRGAAGMAIGAGLSPLKWAGGKMTGALFGGGPKGGGSGGGGSLPKNQAGGHSRIDPAKAQAAQSAKMQGAGSRGGGAALAAGGLRGGVAASAAGYQGGGATSAAGYQGGGAVSTPGYQGGGAASAAGYQGGGAASAAGYQGGGAASAAGYQGGGAASAAGSVPASGGAAPQSQGNMAGMQSGFGSRNSGFNIPPRKSPPMPPGKKY